MFVPSESGVSRVANATLNVDAGPAAVVHVDPEIAIVYGRFAMPWLNSGAVLVDPHTLKTGTAVVQLPGWERRRLIGALRRAGFAVDVHRTAFSMGSNIGSQSEPDRLRGP